MKYKIGKVVRQYMGGGGGATTTPTIPEWMRPSIENVTGKVGESYDRGELSRVAGTSDLQDKAFGSAAGNIASTGEQGLSLLQAQQQRLSNMSATPSPEVIAAQKEAVMQDAQKRTAGLNTQFGNTGTLGSGRQAVMQGAQNAATTAELAKVDADYENKMFQNRLASEQALGTSVGQAGSMASGTASSLASLGGQQRSIEQQQADATWQGIQRLGSTVYGNPARQQTVAGGK